MQLFTISFDVPDAYLDFDTFLESARAAQRTAFALNREIFEDALLIEFIVKAPEAGSLKQVLGIIVHSGKVAGVALGTMAVILAILDSETLQDVSEELTGKDPSDHIIDGLRNLQSRIERATSDGVGEAIFESEEEAHRIVEDLLCRATASALGSERNSIDRLPLPPSTLFEIASSQSKLFRACLDDSRVKAVEFEGTGIPPIRRGDFAERAVPPTRLEEEPEGEWIVRIEKVIVTSPNFDANDQIYRRWKGRNSEGSVRLFTVDDEDFWLRIRKEEFAFRDETELLVQFAVRLEGRRMRFHAVRVLEVEGIRLADPLDDEALKAMLGSFEKRWPGPSEPDLFDIS
ncbi:hypothetical protein [Roseitranquillus sediminis]|uniref:hypothetical protein n=1 Tax=Roseitranquillus sediminis TaxID=2809051 RepID=UPI001D0C7D1A|nr:hypothetical protein [Roseitranquillus sediminis]MBM9595751.1 hypothetical protein [Roseitranquillus sediminis]